MAAELKSEDIRAALAVALGVSRNMPLGDIGASSFLTLLDGTAELTEEFINPPIYEWTLRPVLMIVVPSPDAQTVPDAALAMQIEAAATALETALADQLGGLVTDIRPQAPDMAPRSLWGFVNLKGCELEIEVDYWSSSSLG